MSLRINNKYFIIRVVSDYDSLTGLFCGYHFEVSIMMFYGGMLYLRRFTDKKAAVLFCKEYAKKNGGF